MNNTDLIHTLRIKLSNFFIILFFNKHNVIFTILRFIFLVSVNNVVYLFIYLYRIYK